MTIEKNGLSDFFNTGEVKFEVEKKKKYSNLPQYIDQTKNELATLNEIKEVEKKARIEAINDLREVSRKGNELLDLLIDQIKGESDMEYTSRDISPQTISSVSSLINAIGNVNGKLLDDGKKRIDKLISNTQNNLTVSDSNKVGLSNKDGESSINIETTTSDILRQLRQQEAIEGELNE